MHGATQASIAFPTQGYLGRPVSMEINRLGEKGLGPCDRIGASRKEVQELNFTFCEPACQCQQVIPGGPGLTATDSSVANRKPFVWRQSMMHVVDNTVGFSAKHLTWYAFLASLLSRTEICASDSARWTREGQFRSRAPYGPNEDL